LPASDTVPELGVEPDATLTVPRTGVPPVPGGTVMVTEVRAVAEYVVNEYV
jgi:hypothetical protein